MRGESIYLYQNQPALDALLKTISFVRSIITGIPRALRRIGGSAVGLPPHIPITLSSFPFRVFPGSRCIQHVTGLSWT